MFEVDLTHYEGDSRKVTFTDLEAASRFTFSFRGSYVLAELFEIKDGKRVAIEPKILKELESDYDRELAIKRLDAEISILEQEIKGLRVKQMALIGQFEKKK